MIALHCIALQIMSLLPLGNVPDMLFHVFLIFGYEMVRFYNFLL
jgi:hypothetical protein